MFFGSVVLLRDDYLREKCYEISGFFGFFIFIFYVVYILGLILLYTNSAERA